LLTCPLYAGIDTCGPCCAVKEWVGCPTAGQVTAGGGFLCSSCHEAAVGVHSMLKCMCSAAVSWAECQKEEALRNVASALEAEGNAALLKPIDGRDLARVARSGLEARTPIDRETAMGSVAAVLSQVLEERERKRKREETNAEAAGERRRKKKRTMARALTWDISQLGYDEEKDELRKETKAWERTPSMVSPLTPLSLHDLRVTQDSIRSTDNILPMVDHVRNGGLFSGICVFIFPDGRKFLHDGHHRVLSIWHGGRRHLEAEEYVVINSTYENITSVLFDKFFVTPFDPRTEMRLGEFGEFKKTAWAMHEAGDDEGCLEYVRNNRHLYCMPRTIEWVPDLARLHPLEPSK